MALSEPTTRRGRQTRDQLIAAARDALTEDGYLALTVASIASRANVAVGTLYQYFESKDDLVVAVIDRIADEIFRTGDVDIPHDDTWLSIMSANENFVRFYKQNRELMAVIEQVSTMSPAILDMRRNMRRRTAARIESAIHRLQQQGIADPSLNAHCAATALTSMVSNFVYTWLVIGEPFDDDVVVDTLTRLWANSLGLQYDADGNKASATANPTHSGKLKGN